VKEISDENIIALMQNGTNYERGFTLLMDKYQEPLYWLVRRMVNDHDDANDVTQNAFIKVFKGFSSYKGEAKLYTWLYRIASNEAITFINQKTKKGTASIEEHPLAYSLCADDYFDGNEMQLLLKNAIAQLPDKQRLVFNMRYYEEMPYEEMSNILETSVGALKASFHHAVKKIESSLKQ
jgi:RNA polymerase sigma-70 factor (ECF subfamily)